MSKFDRQTSSMATSAASSCEKLVRIPPEQWTALRDVYRQNWPQNAYSYYALENYINWSRKDPELCEREFRIWSIDEKWREHGIYILEDKTFISHVVRVDACALEHIARYESALNHLKSIPYTELIFREKTSSAVKKYIAQLGYEPPLAQCYPARLYHLRKEDCLKLEVRARSDFIIKPLALTDATEVDDFWAYKAPGSRYIVERNIKYNASLGAYHPESDVLCAWVLYSELGTIACLYVKSEYRRRGLAEFLVKQICRMLTAKNCDATAHIEDTNNASRRLFTKLGFQSVEFNYWFIKADFVSLKKGGEHVERLTEQAMKHG
ncbi:uncharacterized protein LOC128865290 isoform X2 [Anastrepha ludens]|uniref:uncharacterized protein LOC128865290 isoform X2 n=1 Tax=Anastrepha ludens TaxID=28586 RepID=UPI0023B036B5|nr:uncharacterized protein LOC128865290 isoform X2 [Anastrepha ludens]